jgi:FKBP-type peptidyl-prolyl cis-trans isomerase
VLAAWGALAALALAACGDGGSSSTSSAAAAPVTTQTLSREEQERANERRYRLERIKVEKTFVPNPVPEPGNTRPHPRGRVDRLVVRDIKRGRGPALRGDENVYADLSKTYWKTGVKFYAAWGRLRTEYLALSSQAPGISRGMTGMRPGGRRVILMPRTISDIHDPDGTGWEDARVDIVLRKIVPTE